MSRIYKTSAIVEFHIYKNTYNNTFMYIPHQRCVVERGFLPNYMDVIKGGWYKKSDIDLKYRLPINYKKCSPVVEEDSVVCNKDLNPYELVSDLDWLTFDKSNFKKWLMRDCDNEWFHCEFKTSGNNKQINEIEVFDKGEIVITIGSSSVMGLKHIANDFVVDELMVKVAKAINKYPYFKLDGCELVFMSEDLSEKFKI